MVTTKHLPRLGIALLIFWGPVLLFAKLANEVREREQLPIDYGFLNWLHGFSTPFWNTAAIFITNLGSAEVIVALTLVICLALLYKHRRLAALAVFATVGGASLANIILKALFKRSRPAIWSPLVTEHSYSFPSGHAMASSALCFAVILLLWPTRWRWYALAIGLTFTVLVGLSRLYLGVHYPSDVLAGWLVSGLWAVIVSSLIYNFPFAVDRLPVVNKLTQRLPSLLKVQKQK